MALPISTCTTPTQAAAHPLSRRQFLGRAAAAVLAVGARPMVGAGSPSGWFGLTRTRGRDFFTTPAGAPFFSLGLNHFDSATLRTGEGLPVWRERYGNSQERWIKEAVAPDLDQWGFNTNGYTHEMVLKGGDRFRRSRLWTYEEFQWLDRPYCHTLNFLNFNYTDLESRYLDVFSREFEDFCDYTAREIVALHAHDPKLVGWFFTDCPTWTFSMKPAVKPPLFDPRRLVSEEGRAEFERLVTRYYEVTTAAVRRYDAHHLILGDRFEGRSPLPDTVLRVAARFVDVLCFQYFPQDIAAMSADLRRWHELTGKPLLIADAAPPARAIGRYGDLIEAVAELPFIVGFHYCGAYLKNNARGHGLRDHFNRELVEITGPVRRANQRTLQKLGLAHP